MIRRIRDLLYDQGFTITGARNKMQELLQAERDIRRNGDVPLEGTDALEMAGSRLDDFEDILPMDGDSVNSETLHQVRRELFEIRDLLTAA
jgi:hypothetical protein